MGNPSTSRHASDNPAGDPADSIYGVPTGANRSFGDLISPDDWRLFHLTRELPDQDRARIIASAGLRFNMREGRRWAESSVVSRNAIVLQPNSSATLVASCHDAAW